MALEDPRGSLPYSSIQILPLPHSLGDRRRLTKFPSSRPVTRTKSPLCLDWIVSSATNVHVAADRAHFKTYKPFQSFTLAISDHHRVPVEGIGQVELKIRCKQGSKESHTISLDTVLHVPSWPCNIFSHIYFDPPADYNHRWIAKGVHFMAKQNGKFKSWGYTEEFCGLDRLVLSQKQNGRSPMLEDPDREIWSVSLHWPDSQRKKWHDFQSDDTVSQPHQAMSGSRQLLTSTKAGAVRIKQQRRQSVLAFPDTVFHPSSSNQLYHGLNKQSNTVSADLEGTSRSTYLKEVNKNIPVSTKSRVGSGLKTMLSTRGLLKDFFHSSKNIQY